MFRPLRLLLCFALTLVSCAPLAAQERLLLQPPALGPVRDCQFSADGALLLHRGPGPFVSLWDLQTGKRRWEKPADGWNSARLAADGRTVLLSGAPGTATWDAATGEPLRQVADKTAWHTPDGKALVVARDRGLLVCDPSGTKVLHTLVEPQLAPTVLTLSPRGDLLAAGLGNKLAVLEMKVGRWRTLANLDKRLLGLAFTPDGTALVGRDESGGEFVRSAADGKERWETDDLRVVAVAPRGDRLIGSDMLGQLSVHRLRDGKREREWDKLGMFHQARFVADGAWAALLNSAGGLLLAEVGGEGVKRLAADAPQLTAVAVSPDGKAVAGGRSDGSVLCWPLAGGKAVILRQGDEHSYAPLALHWSPDGKKLVVVTPVRADVLDAADGKALASLPCLDFRPELTERPAALLPQGLLISCGLDDDKHTKLFFCDLTKDKSAVEAVEAPRLNQLDFADGGRFLLGWYDRQLTIWNVATRKQVATLTDVEWFAAAPNKPLLVTRAPDGKLVLWDLRLPQDPERDLALQVRSVPGKSPSGAALRFSPDGNWIVHGRAGGDVQLIEVNGGEKATPPAPLPAYGEMAFSPDGKRVLGWMRGENYLGVWEVKTGKLLARLRPPRSVPGERDLVLEADRALLPGAGAVWDLTPLAKPAAQPPVLPGQDLCEPARALLPTADPGVVLSWETSHALRLLDANKGKVKGTLHEPVVQGRQLATSPDGRVLYVGRSDGSVEVWDTDAASKSFGTRVKVLSGGGQPVELLECSPDGRWLAAAGRTGVRVWPLADEREVVLAPADVSAFTRLHFSPGHLTARLDGGRLVRWDLTNFKEQDVENGGWEQECSGDVLVRRNDGGLEALDLLNPQAPPRPLTGYLRPGATAVSPDGRFFAAQHLPGRLYLWDLTTGKQVGTFPLAKDSADVRLEFAANSAVLLVQEAAGAVRLIDPAAGRECGKVAPPKGAAARTLSADGALLVWVGAQTHVIDTRSLQTMGTLGTFDAGAPAYQRSPDGKLLLLGEPGKPMQLWSLAADPPTVLNAQLALGIVAFAVFSPAGQTLALRDLRGTALQLFDASTGKPLPKLKGQPTRQPVYSPDGRLMLTGNGATATIYNVDPKSAQYGDALPALEGQVDAADNVFFSPGGRWLAHQPRGGNWRLLETSTGKARDLNLHGARPAFADDNRLVLTLPGGVVEAVEVDTGRRVPHWCVARQFPTSIQPDPSGRFLLGFHGDGEVIVWDADGKEQRRFRVPAADLHAPPVVVGADTLLLLDRQGAKPALRAWDWTTGKERPRITLGEKEGLGYPVFAAQGRRLAWVDGNSILCLTEVSTGKSLGTCGGGMAPVTFSPNGKWLLARGFKGLMLIDVEPGSDSFCKVTLTLENHEAGPRPFSQDGKWLATMPAGAQTVEVRDVRVKSPTWGKALRTLAGRQTPLFSPDGRFLVAHNPDREGVELWPADATEESVAPPLLAWKSPAPTAPDFSADGRLLLTPLNGGKMEVLDLAASPPELKGNVSSPAVVAAPDGAAVFTLDDALGRIERRTVPAEKGKPLGEPRLLRDEGPMVLGSAVSADGKWLALGLADNRVKVIPADPKGKPLMIGVTCAPQHLAFHPDGTRLLAWGTAGQVSLCQLDGAGKAVELGTLAPGQPRVEWTARGKYIFLDEEGGATLWGSDDGKRLDLPPVVAGRGARPIAELPDGTLSLHTPGQNLERYDPATGKRSTIYRWDAGPALTALSGDGKLLAVVPSNDRPAVRLWDTAARKYLPREFTHGAAVHKLALSPDGATLVAVDVQTRLTVWDVATGARLVEADECQADELAFSADGKRLVTAGRDGRLTAWALGKEPQARELLAPSLPITDLVASPDGALLAAVVSGRPTRSGYLAQPLVAVWDVATGKRLYAVHNGCAAAFSPDGKTLAVLCVDPNGGVRLHDPRTGKPTTERLAFAVPTRTTAGRLEYSADGDYLLAGASAMQSRVLHISDPAKRYVIPGHMDSRFSPDGKRVLSAELTGTVIYETATGKEESRAPGLGQPLQGPGATILVGLTQAGVQLRSGTAIHTIEGEMRPVGFLPSGNELLLADRHALSLWSTTQMSLVRRLEAGKDREFGRAALAPDGRTVAVTTASSVEVLEVATGEVRLRVPGSMSDMPVYFPDGKTLAVVGTDGSLRLWHTRLLRTAATLDAHRGAAQAVALSPTGDRLATVGSDHSVKLWDVRTGKLLQARTGHTAPVLAVAFSLDGKLLATGGADRTVRVWDLAHNDPATVLDDHTGAVWSLAFAPDGKRLLSGSADRTIRVWQVESTPQGPRIKGGSTTWKGAEQPVLALQFSADGATLFSGEGDPLDAKQPGIVRLWDVERGKARLALPAHAGGVRALALSPDGATLATGGGDRLIKLWAADLKDEKAAPLAVLRAHGQALQGVTFADNGLTLLSVSGVLSGATQAGEVFRWDVKTGAFRPPFTAGPGFLGLAASADGKTVWAAGADGKVRQFQADGP